MLRTISRKKSIDPSAYLLLTTIFLTTFLGCSHNISSDPKKEPEEFESEIVSIRNPNIIIQPPVIFAWLPESINAYYLAGLVAGSKDLPAQRTIQEAITKYLTTYGYVYNGSVYSSKDAIARRRKRTNIQPKDLIVVKNWTWAGANFGASGLLKEITLENRGNQNVTDLKIKIGYLGTKGAKEGYWGPTSIFVIHDLLPANSEKTFRDINIGFRHPDERKENMSVLSVKTIIHDLLIGYYLVPENALNDQDLNRTYNLTVDPSGNNSKNNINEYKKGTVIIDVIDAENNVSVWRGAVQALPSFDIPENAKRNRVKLAVEKLVDNFIMSNQ